MTLQKRDLIATVLVAVAGVLYLLWLSDVTLPGMDNTRMTGVAILGLGFAASATAVVPGFDELIHGNKIYLAVMSLLGVVALIGAVTVLVAASEVGLTVVVVTMVVLWAIATIHHSLLATTPQSEPTDLRMVTAPRSRTGSST